MSEDQDLTTNANHSEPGEKVNDKVMDRVYKEYKRQFSRGNSQGAASMSESDVELGFNVTHNTIRKDDALSDQEKQYLVAVERGDLASARSFLELAEVSVINTYNANEMF